MNKLLSFDKSAVVSFNVMANISFIVPYHNTVGNMTSGGKITVDCVMFIRNRCEKKLYRSRLSGPLLSAKVRFIDYQITNSVPFTFSFICEVQLLDSNYGFVWHRKDNACNNKVYLLYFTHDTKCNNPQPSKILICSDKRAKKYRACKWKYVMVCQTLRIG
jgi:hypothetical protein